MSINYFENLIMWVQVQMNYCFLKDYAFKKQRLSHVGKLCYLEFRFQFKMLNILQCSSVIFPFCDFPKLTVHSHLTPKQHQTLGLLTSQYFTCTPVQSLLSGYCPSPTNPWSQLPLASPSLTVSLLPSSSKGWGAV